MGYSITILGATGSIGSNTLAVIAQNPENYCIEALTAYCDVEKLYTQCLQYCPRYAVMVDKIAAKKLVSKLRDVNLKTQVLVGEDALVQVARDSGSDVVVAAIVGMAGLLPTLAAVEAGKRVLLANKEALVVSGHLLSQAVKQFGATLLPIDSEHNAILQCLPSNYQPMLNKVVDVNRIVLTASGGPFRQTPMVELEKVTPKQALEHPNWVMGPKVSVDSATMINKGLEVVEAHWLFGFPLGQIEIILHPQSVIHSLVYYRDGSVLAQLGVPDMRIPIAYALSWPERRIPSGAAQLVLSNIGKLEFIEVPPNQYPCLSLVYQALQRGGTALCLLNAANEVAVDAFLKKRISFIQIPQIIREVLEKYPAEAVKSIEQVLCIDTEARIFAQSRFIGNNISSKKTRRLRRYI